MTDDRATIGVEGLDPEGLEAAFSVLWPQQDWNGGDEGFCRAVAEKTIRAYLSRARPVVSDAMVEAALHARVPGGSEVWAWLPQEDAWTPHQTARDVMRAALDAALAAQPQAEPEVVAAQCTVCKGSGWTEPSVSCFRCNGTGITSPPAPDALVERLRKFAADMRLTYGAVTIGENLALEAAAALAGQPEGWRTESGLKALRSANDARQALWCPEQIPDLSFRGNELAGETGEVCNVIKKLERERLGWRGSRDTVAHLAEELADVVICADLVAISAGIDLDAAVIEKFNATSQKVGLAVFLPAAPAPTKGGE